MGMDHDEREQVPSFRSLVTRMPARAAGLTGSNNGEMNR